MVDLINQFEKIKPEVLSAFESICESAQFIKGPAVKSFEQNLAEYLNVKHVIGCANGTDALQVAFMALGLEPNDEVIVPAFTYVAPAEVIGFLKLKPVMVDIDPDTFNITADIIKEAITPKTKAIVPVHLFGQSCDMEPILDIAKEYNLKIVEDNAQSLGSDYTLDSGEVLKTGTSADIGTTSFFPSKNLGCYGDGGALFTNNDDLADLIRIIVNHGQKKKYHHSIIGCNSRLDTLQAAVLNIKLEKLHDYNITRRQVANTYNEAFQTLTNVSIPSLERKSSHIYHQYTLKIKNGKRDELIGNLTQKNIATRVYYPIPLYKQEAFQRYVDDEFVLPNTERLCKEVVSLPIHTELEPDTQKLIIDTVLDFFT